MNFFITERVNSFIGNYRDGHLDLLKFDNEPSFVSYHFLSNMRWGSFPRKQLQPMWCSRYVRVYPVNQSMPKIGNTIRKNLFGKIFGAKGLKCRKIRVRDLRIRDP